MGSEEGSIIAIIIACHMTTNIAAAASRPWPGIGIHIIDMVQLPVIGMPPPIDRAECSVRRADDRNATAALM